MPKTRQAKLDYIKRWKEQKREEAKQNGTYTPPGRPRVPAKTLEEKREYQRQATRKHNVIISTQRLAARLERNKRKEELNTVIERIKSIPYEELAKVKEIIFVDTLTSIARLDNPSNLSSFVEATSVA